MAYSQSDIINLAILKQASDATIAAVTDEAKQARVFNRLWDPTRQFVLSDGVWPWAMKSQALALSDDPPEQGWGYRYAYPNNCLNAWAVTTADGLRMTRSAGGIACFCDRNWCDQAGVPSEDFDLVFGQNETEILTDVKDAYVIFTVDMEPEDTGRFPILFVDALACKLAADGIAVIGEVGINAKTRFLQEYELAKSKALAHALNQSRNSREPLPPSWRARGDG